MNRKETAKNITINHEDMRFTYNLEEGVANLYWKDKGTIENIYSSVILKDGTELKSKTYKKHLIIEKKEIEDSFGSGIKMIIGHQSENRPDLHQTFYFYKKAPYIIADVTLQAEKEVETNHMVPFQTEQFSTSFIEEEKDSDPRTLFVPYDNDKWIRYNAHPITDDIESSEATSLYDNESRSGVVLGSVSHDLWKTGIKIGAYHKEEKSISVKVYGGAANEVTRDTIPHGYVKGKNISSSKIFIGFFEDYREGLEEYGQANTIIQPPLPWEEGVPFGWNSWSAVADQLDYDAFRKTSDFFKESLQNNHFENNDKVYINFDSFWDNLTDEQVAEAVTYAQNNGQKAGIYFTPFTYWFSDFDREVEGIESSYHYRELLLKDHEGNILPSLDGGYSLDPTHPGTIERLQWQFQRFVDWGYDYVKLDFMAHGAMEGDHYRKEIHTGKQAYNYGMQHIVSILDPEKIGRPFFINLSISPIFPYAYAHSRRVSCDVFGSLGSTEYLLNSLTYGWWINDGIYPFNDPDHTVLYKSFNEDSITENEALSRLNASVIAGTVFLGGDDYRIEEARLRAKKFLTNEKVNAIARKGLSFIPVEGNTGDKADDTFYLHDKQTNERFIAVFNFNDQEAKAKVVDLSRVGFAEDVTYDVLDLWSGKEEQVTGEIHIDLPPAGSTILQLKV